MESNVINKNTSETNIVQGLYGSEIYAHKSCGYCGHHKCYLTVKMLRQHECLQKQCNHLEKNLNHSWWKQREVIKNRRKARKERLK